MIVRVYIGNYIGNHTSLHDQDIKSVYRTPDNIDSLRGLRIDELYIYPDVQIDNHQLHLLYRMVTVNGGKIIPDAKRYFHEIEFNKQFDDLFKD